jgi:hypothetical protein
MSDDNMKRMMALLRRLRREHERWLGSGSENASRNREVSEDTGGSHETDDQG